MNIREEEKQLIPIFICGMPRSGTTLCEQILSSHSKIDGAGEQLFDEVSDLRILLHLIKDVENFEIN